MSGLDNILTVIMYVLIESLILYQERLEGGEANLHNSMEPQKIDGVSCLTLYILEIVNSRLNH